MGGIFVGFRLQKGTKLATTSMQIPINMQDSVQPSPSPRQLLATNKREDRSRRRNSLLQEKERLLQELEALEVNEKAVKKSTRASPNVYQYSPRQPQGRSRRKTFNQMMTSPQW